MRTVEMLRDTRSIYHLVLLVSLSVGYVQPLPLQVLPSIPGYIPVYIRYGDQPLDEINPALAEAFHERSGLSKNIHLDNVAESTDLNPEEDGENKYKIEAVHIRQVDNNFSDKSEGSKKPPEKIAHMKTEENEADSSNKGTHHEKSRRKIAANPVVKLLPLTEEEKKALEMLQIKLREEDESQSNTRKETKGTSNVEEKLKNYSESAHDSNQFLPKSSEEKPNDKDNKESSDSITKVDSIITDEQSQPNLRLNKNEEASVPPLTNNESPIKEQRLPNVLSNVHKLSPSPEILLQLEKERAENQSLEEKSN